MVNFSYGAVSAYACALIGTLALAAWLTPAHWWRRPNARALAIVMAGTWGLGTLGLWLFDPSPNATMTAAVPTTHGLARLAPTVTTAANAIEKGRVSYRVQEDLNLRQATGTSAARIAVVPAGSVVTTTGQRDGDWWQVSAKINGRTVKGWSSSLWLRRADETAWSDH